MPHVAPHEVLSDWSAVIDEVIAANPGPGWRQALLANGDTRVVLIGWPAGFRSIPHHHPYATETFQVLAGRLGFRLDDRAELDLGPGGIAIAHRGQVHGLRVRGATRLVFLACVSPNQDLPDEQVDTPDRWPDWQPSDPSVLARR